MALQLIYTSAPRLLEAGRTGFGTVARHRAVSGLLAAAVERFSQFARLPGHDPRRVVHCHRLVTVGPTTFHVLSCLRDAGSDYTGRTNHMAHHLIAEEREVRALAAVGITPADVLLAMPWRETWTESARFLDPAEEIDLAALRARPTEAWYEITGEQRNALLPWTPAAQKGCYLIAAEGAPVTALFLESLQERMQQAWQTTFTTCLEPNDDVADFRWIGITAASPMRAQAENSSRQVFDLLQPSRLPTPPPPENAPPEVPEHEQAVPAWEALPEPTLSPSREKLPAPHLRTAGRPPPPSLPGMLKSAAASTSAPPTAGMLGDWSPEPRKAAGAGKSKMPLILGLAVVVSLLVSGGGVAFLKWNEGQQKQETDKLVQNIERVWDEHHMGLESTKATLKEQAAHPDKAERAKVQPTLDFYAQQFAVVNACLQDPAQVKNLRVPESGDREELKALHAALRKWAESTTTEDILLGWSEETTPTTMIEALDAWVTRQKDAWKKCAVIFNTPLALPPSKQGYEAFQAKVAAALKADTKPPGKPVQWQQLLSTIGEGLKAASGQEKSLAWLGNWAALEAGGMDMMTAKTLSNELDGNPDAPGWLKSLAARKATDAAAAMGVETVPVMPGPAVAGEDRPVIIKQREEADAAGAKHPVYLKVVSAGEKAVRITANALEGNPKPRLFLGGADDIEDQLKEWGFQDRSYREKMMRPDLGEVFIQGHDITLPVGENGRRLVARSADGNKVLFEIKVIVEGKNADMLKFAHPPVFTLVNAPDGEQSLDIGWLLDRLEVVGQPGATFCLVATTVKGQRFELKKLEKGRWAVLPVKALPVIGSDTTSVLNRDINDLIQIIKLLEKQIQDMEKSKLADKEAKLADLQRRKAEKEGALQDKQSKLADMKGMAASVPVIRLVEGGPYHLAMEVPGVVRRTVCEIQVNVALKNPKP